MASCSACCSTSATPLQPRRAARPQRHVRASAGATAPKTRPRQAQQILELIRGQDRGRLTSPQQKAQVFALVDELRAQPQQQSFTEASLLSATWQLLWTSEQETLWILNNAGLFGTKAGDVFQVIDVPTSRLQNVITFPPEGAFVVDSSIHVDGPQRVGFKFSAAKLQLPQNRVIPVPPFGQGWFDNVYVDEEVRIAKDVRNDVLVVERDGPPRIF